MPININSQTVRNKRWAKDNIMATGNGKNWLSNNAIAPSLTPNPAGVSIEIIPITLEVITIPDVSRILLKGIVQIEFRNT